MRSDERPWRAVPAVVLLGFSLLLAGQVLLRAVAPAPRASATDLDQPPGNELLRVAAFGEPIALAYTLALRLQAFDNQPGISIPFARLDYERVEAWLAAGLALDGHSQYPLLMASHLYAQVAGHPDKQRSMSEFVYRQFLADPGTRWPWLAHVAIMAKHRLHDMPLAIRYADAIRDHARGADVPAWARQMHIFLREDVGELESARALLGGLLDSGTVTDPQEFRFLSERLRALEAAEKSTNPSKQ